MAKTPQYRRVKGTQDLFPADTRLWNQVEQTFVKTSSHFGFGEIRTPVLESLELFVRSVGEATDIVQKEMYTLEDRKGRQLALRPENTAAIVRAFVQEGLDRSSGRQKLFYIGPMFRYEQPQKGRLRQFHQLGAEIFGSDDPLAELELLELAWTFLESLGLSRIELRINSLGDESCRETYRNALLQYLRQHQQDLSPDSQTRLETNPLRVLDSKDPRCQAVLENAPQMHDYLSDEAQKHFSTVQALLKEAGREFTVDPRMVRGLDYYNRTVFEFVGSDLGAQNALCGGGRYDQLVEDLGGQPTPAIGLAMGLERLILTLSALDIKPDTTPLTWLAYLGDDCKKDIIELSKVLRNQRVTCDYLYRAKNLKQQLTAADKAGAAFAVIRGEQEQQNQTFVVKDLEKREEQTVEAAQIVQHLKSILENNHD